MISNKFGLDLETVFSYTVMFYSTGLRGLTIGYSLARIDVVSQKTLAGDNHSSLFCSAVGDAEKPFLRRRRQICCVVRDKESPSVFGYVTATQSNSSQTMAHVFTTDSPVGSIS
jgi:hypothetical protein